LVFTVHAAGGVPGICCSSHVLLSPQFKGRINFRLWHLRLSQRYGRWFRYSGVWPCSFFVAVSECLILNSGAPRIVSNLSLLTTLFHM
jgi:hypothetical protein